MKCLKTTRVNSLYLQQLCQRLILGFALYRGFVCGSSCIGKVFLDLDINGKTVKTVNSTIFKFGRVQMMVVQLRAPRTDADTDTDKNHNLLILLKADNCDRTSSVGQ